MMWGCRWIGRNGQHHWQSEKYGKHESGLLVWQAEFMT